MNPDFPLASWEVPPGSGVPLVAPADLVFDAIWRGRETQLLVRKIETANGPRVYFREADSTEVGNWALETYLFDCDLADVFGDDVVNADDYNWEFSVKRCFYFDGTRYGYPGVLELNVGLREGTWCKGEEQTYFTTQWWQIEEFLCERASTIGRIARIWLEKPESQICLALEWLHLSREEKQSRAFGMQPAQMAELKTLMRHVLNSQPSLWASAASSGTKGSSLWRISDEPDRGYYDYWDDVGGQGEVFSGSELWLSGEQCLYSEVLPCIHRWREVLWRHFTPRIDPQFFEYARTTDITYNLCWIEVTAQPPTAHEMLESRLALRDWWSNVAAPEQFARLMDE